MQRPDFPQIAFREVDRNMPNRFGGLSSQVNLPGRELARGGDVVITATVMAR